MKKEIIIGRKPRVIVFYLKCIVSSLILYLLYEQLMEVTITSKFGMENPSFIEGTHWMCVLGYVIFLLMLLASLGSKQYFVIDQDYFRYYSCDSIISRLEDALMILLRRPRKSLMKIPMNQFKTLTLLYNDVETLWYFKGHCLIYCLELKNGNILKISPESFDFSNKSILEGIHFMENQGIEICDPYHLIQGLQCQDMRLSEYIDKVVIKHEHHL